MLHFLWIKGHACCYIDIQGPDWVPEPFAVSNTEDPTQQTGSNPPCTRHFVSAIECEENYSPPMIFGYSQQKSIFSLSFCIEKNYFSSSYITVCFQSLCFAVHKLGSVYFFVPWKHFLLFAFRGCWNVTIYLWNVAASGGCFLSH